MAILHTPQGLISDHDYTLNENPVLLTVFYSLFTKTILLIEFKTILQIYENIRKYTIFFQYTKIHIR